MVIIKLDVPRSLDNFGKIQVRNVYSPVHGLSDIQNLPYEQICVEYKPIESLKKLRENLYCLCKDCKENIKNIPIVQRLIAPRVCSVCELKDTVLKNYFSSEFVDKVNTQANEMDQFNQCQCGDKRRHWLDYEYDPQDRSGHLHRHSPMRRSVPKYPYENDRHCDDLWDRQFQRWWGWNYGRRRKQAQTQWSPQYTTPCRCISEDWYNNGDVNDGASDYVPYQPVPETYRKKRSCWKKMCDWCCGTNVKRKRYPDYYQPPHICSNYECPCQIDIRGRRHHQKAEDRVHQSWMHDRISSSISSNASHHSCSSIEYLTCRIKAVVDEDDDCSCCCCCPCRVQCQPAVCQTEGGSCNKQGCTQTDQRGKRKRKCCKCCESFCKNNANALCNRKNNAKTTVANKNKHSKRNSNTNKNEFKSDKTKIYRANSTQHEGFNLMQSNNISCISTIPTPENVYYSHVKTSPLFLDPIFSSPITGRKYTIAPKTKPDVNHKFSTLPKPISVPCSLDLDVNYNDIYSKTNKLFKKPKTEEKPSEEFFDLDYNNITQRYSQQNLEEALHKLDNANDKSVPDKETLIHTTGDSLNGLLQASQIVKNVMANFKLSKPIQPSKKIPCTTNKVETERVPKVPVCKTLQMTTVNPINITSCVQEKNSTSTLVTTSLPSISILSIPNQIKPDLPKTSIGVDYAIKNYNEKHTNAFNVIPQDELESCESSSTYNETSETYSELTDHFGPLPVIAKSRKSRSINDFFKRKRKQSSKNNVLHNDIGC